MINEDYEKYKEQDRERKTECRSLWTEQELRDHRNRVTKATKAWRERKALNESAKCYHCQFHSTP